MHVDSNNVVTDLKTGITSAETSAHLAASIKARTPSQHGTPPANLDHHLSKTEMLFSPPQSMIPASSSRANRVDTGAMNMWELGVHLSSKAGWNKAVLGGAS